MTTDDDLIAYVDGEKTSQQAAALEILLTDDADLRARLSQLLRQRLLLAEVHREVAFRQNGSGSSTSNSAARSVSSRRLRVIPRLSSRRQTTWWISALAAGLLVLVSVVLSQRQIQAPVVASLRQATTGVSVLRTGKQREARSGVLFVAGDRVRVPARACAVIDFPDGSQVTVGTAVDESIVVVADVPGRSMTLERGSLEAEVRPQPIGNPFVVGTSLADAIVIGTHFMLVANPDATQLTVSRGVVRLIRHGDRASIDVQAGFLAVAKAQGNLHALSTTGSAVVVAPAPIAIDPAPATAVSSTGVSLLPERPWVGATVATDNGLGVPRELLRINGQPWIGDIGPSAEIHQGNLQPISAVNGKRRLRFPNRVSPVRWIGQ